MPLIRLVVILLATLCLACPVAAQADRLDAILARGSLRVGTTGDYKPFSYRGPAASPYIGLDIELAGQLASALGVRLELVPSTWPTLMRDLEADRFDMAMGGVSISLERQKTALFSIPYLQDGKTPIARCDQQARFQTLAQIDQPGTRLIVNPGGTNERFVRVHASHATLTVFPDNIGIFEELLAGRADVMITDAIEARLQQRLHPQLCALHPDAPFDFSEKAYLLPRDLLWKAYVDQWLHQSLASGSFARLLDKWLAHPWPQAAPARIGLEPLARLINARLALMPDVAAYKWNTGTAIEDVPREQQIIAGLKAQAQEMGIPASWAERFFRAQIEAAKQVQREYFARWTQAGTGKLAQAPDLASVTRPRLDALTPQLLRELALAWPALADPAQQERVAQALRQASHPAADGLATQLAILPLIDGSASLGQEPG